MPFHIIKEVRDINRFNQILLVLFEEGFDLLLSKINGLEKSKRKPKKMNKHRFVTVVLPVKNSHGLFGKYIEFFRWIFLDKRTSIRSSY